MFIAILGVIAVIVGMVMKRSPEPANKFARIVTNVGIVVILLGILTSSYKQIEPGQVGVVDVVHVHHTVFGAVGR